MMSRGDLGAKVPMARLFSRFGSRPLALAPVADRPRDFS
jgi:hypothetical protein